MIVATISSYREGRLLVGAVESALRGCDRVIVLEGAVGEAAGESPGEPSPLELVEAMGALVLEPSRPHLSDAAKRTHLLHMAKDEQKIAGRTGEPLWLLMLDGDELLLWPEYLQDLTHRADLEPNATGGFALRIVELDGSVGYAYNKVIRAEGVRKYLESGYQLELHTGMVVALPNVRICAAGGIPVAPQGGPPADQLEQERWLARCRPPVQGEPHLLHRSMMRHPDRAGVRLNEVEAEWFPAALEQAGLKGVDE